MEDKRPLDYSPPDVQNTSRPLICIGICFVAAFIGLLGVGCLGSSLSWAGFWAIDGNPGAGNTSGRLAAEIAALGVGGLAAMLLAMRLFGWAL